MSLGSARDALLEDARTRAREIVAAGEAEAAQQTGPARRQAEEILAAARAQGESEGRREAAREEAAEHAAARATVLAAQRESYDELCRRARVAALSLRSEPDYARLLEHLSAAARQGLGEDAELELDPPELGGVRASAGTRALDYTLVAIAERCVDGLGPRLTALWS
ncbi:MAG: V-type ATP synthase subunit E family protein [Thermoleophilaceae bacterium]